MKRFNLWQNISFIEGLVLVVISLSLATSHFDQSSTSEVEQRQDKISASKKTNKIPLEDSFTYLLEKQKTILLSPP